MAGYSRHHGMSNNAVFAYNNGVKPLSKIAIDDLRAAGWRGTKALAVRLAKAGVWAPAEWHHSGGTWYNKVDFYNPAHLLDAWGDLETLEQEAYLAARKGDLAPKTTRVKGSYATFGGSRKTPRYLGETAFIGHLIGDWIHLDDGGRKKANGNNIKFEELK